MLMMDYVQPCLCSREGFPGSAGTRQTHMTLNSDRKVSWDCFGLSD